MKEFLPVLHSSVLLSGISEEDLISMLACLDVKTKSYPKDAFLFRAGDTAESIGLVLSGTILIIQEDVWGNRNIISKAAPGQTFAAAYACAPGSVMDVSVSAETPVTVMFLNVNRVMHTCPSACARHSRIILNLLGELAEKNLRFAEKLTHIGQRTTRKAYVLLLCRSATARKMRIRYSVFQATTRGLSCGRTQRLIARTRKNATRRTSEIS